MGQEQGVTYVMGQVNVYNATVPVFTLPAGLCNCTFWNVSATNLYLGTNAAVTISNGLQCHSIPTNFFTYVSNKGATIYGANPTAFTATINYIIVTDQ
jgi:hypothetical protein